MSEQTLEIRQTQLAYLFFVKNKSGPWLEGGGIKSTKWVGFRRSMARRLLRWRGLYVRWRTVNQAEVPKNPPPKNTQIHNVAERESLAKVQKDDGNGQSHITQMATQKTANDTMAATQSTNKEANERRNDKTEKATTRENKKTNHRD